MEKDFTVYWAQKRGTPEQLASVGLKRIPLIRGARWGNPIDVEKTLDVVTPHQFHERYVTNIEAPWNDMDWRTEPELAAEHRALYVDMLERAILNTPDTKVSLWSIAPRFDYEAAALGSGQLFEDWQANNDYVKPIAQLLHFMCPSFYTNHPTIITEPAVADVHAFWPRFVDNNVRECERIGGVGKPILPFLWHRYRDGTGGTLYGLTAEEFANELYYLYRHPKIAGAIIWQPSASPFDYNEVNIRGLVLFQERVQRERRRGELPRAKRIVRS